MSQSNASASMPAPIPINSPIIQRAVAGMIDPTSYRVVICTYACGAENPVLVGQHRTLRAACRTLASFCSGKRRQRGSFAAFVILPTGQLYSLVEARKL